MLSDDDELFTFRVGPKKQIFQVDKKMVAQASPVFDRMMSNGMKETQDRTADLPEVEPNTFLTFLNFAYHAAEAQRDTSKPARYTTSTFAVVGPFIVLMVDAGQKTFRCHGCCRSAKLQFSGTFPFCGDCPVSEPLIAGCGRGCICHTCTRHSCDTLYACGMLCVRCAGELDLLPDSRSAQLFLPGVYRMQDDIDFFRFDVPMLAKEAASEMRRTTQTTCRGNTVEIMKIFAFSDTYGVTRLRKLALCELFETLASGEPPKALSDLITHIYGTTPNSGIEATFEQKHVLRRIISAYAAYHGKDVHIFLEISRLVSIGGEFAVDLFMATSMVANGNLGKGWQTESE